MLRIVGKRSSRNNQLFQFNLNSDIRRWDRN